MKRLIMAVILAWIGHLSLLTAQVSKTKTPYSFEHILPKVADVELMPALDMAKVERDRKDNEFGVPHKVNLNLENAGEWIVLDNEDQIWRLTISAPKAKSINLIYRDFWLPEGASLHIYNKDRTQVLGAFTNRNNKGQRADTTTFATALILGDELTLEYYEPFTVIGQGQIEIGQVIHGYLNAFEDNSKAYGDSNDCQNNINCSVGSEWQNEKKGVALIVMGGGTCSGALVNTYANEYVPYFLTADHCSDLDAINGSRNAGSWVFYWNYETPTCSNPTRNPILNAQTTTGAVLVSNRMESDFALLRLLERPAGAWYLGWAAGNQNPRSGAGIHHPRGDAKKISIQNDESTSDGRTIRWYDHNGNHISTTPPHTHWHVRFDDGGTEPGSSGSPFFDQNHRIVGQLHGGSGSCPGDDDFEAMYGKLSYSWSAGDRRRRLRDWIGQQCTDHHNITTALWGEQPVYRANKIDGRSQVGWNAFVRYEGTSYVDLEPGFDAFRGSDFMASIGTGCSSNGKGGSETKSLQAPYVNTVDEQGNEILPPLEMEETAKLEDRSTQNIASDGLLVSPNPFSESTTVRWTLTKPETVVIILLNAYGQQIKEIQAAKQYEAGQHQIVFQANDLASGLYHIVLKSSEKTRTQSVVVNSK